MQIKLLTCAFFTHKRHFFLASNHHPSYNLLMKKYFVLVIAALTLWFVIEHFSSQENPSAEETLLVSTKKAAPASPPESSASLLPESKKINPDFKQKKVLYLGRFKEAGLSEVKANTLISLMEFHHDSPAYNEENIKRHTEMLEELNYAPGETAEAFKQLISKTPTSDDSLKSLLINTTMQLNLSEEEKASVLSERALQKVQFRDDGTVTDDELSLMVALSHLHRLKDSEVKADTLEKIIKQHQSDPLFMAMLKDFLPAR
jgi:hypothetical protein